MVEKCPVRAFMNGLEKGIGPPVVEKAAIQSPHPKALRAVSKG